MRIEKATYDQFICPKCEEVLPRDNFVLSVDLKRGDFGSFLYVTTCKNCGESFETGKQVSVEGKKL